MSEAEKMAERLEERGKRTPRTWATSDLYYEAAALIRRLVAERAKLVEALTPSGDTKAAYHGEFSFSVTSQFWDDVTEEWETRAQNTLVPWTTVKEIMAAIRARAAIEVKHEP
jgi:hypothetical protein